MSSSYVTITEFKESVWYPEDFFTNNEQISGFLDEVAGIIDDYCGRTFTTGAYTDQFTGGDTGTYFTRSMPLNSISSITYQYFDNKPNFSSAVVTFTSPGTSGTISSGSYTFTSAGMIKSNVKFGSNAIWTITYNAGFNTVPQPIKTANMMLAKLLCDASDNGNLAWADGSAIAQFKFGKFAEMYSAGTNRMTGIKHEFMPPTVAALLKRYRLNKSI